MDLSSPALEEQLDRDLARCVVFCVFCIGLMYCVCVCVMLVVLSYWCMCLTRALCCAVHFTVLALIICYVC